MRRAALALLTVTFAATLMPWPWGDERLSDIPVYRAYADVFLAGAMPYREVAFEYPPLAAGLLALPGLAGTEVEAYRLAFAALAFVLAAAVMLLCGALAGRTGGDRRRALIAAAAAPLLAGALIRTRFDLAPVGLVLGALCLLCVGQPRAGLAALGLGVMTKAFPLVIAPVALAWIAGRGDWRAAIEAGLALVLTLAAVGGAAAVLSPAGAVDAVSYHLSARFRSRARRPRCSWVSTPLAREKERRCTAMAPTGSSTPRRGSSRRCSARSWWARSRW